MLNFNLKVMINLLYLFQLHPFWAPLMTTLGNKSQPPTPRLLGNNGFDCFAKIAGCDGVKAFRERRKGQPKFHNSVKDLSSAFTAFGPEIHLYKA